MASIRIRKTDRVFVDSSVLIAAAISSRGTARDLLRQGFRGELEVYVSTDVLAESERNVSLKAPEALPDLLAFRKLLAAKLVEPTHSQIVTAHEVVAAKDAPIIAATVRAGAQYLATYDRRHLLSRKQEIEDKFGIIVVTPDGVAGRQGS